MKPDTTQYKKQAGCVPIKRIDNVLHVLLVTNKSGKNWVLPKGSIKRSEVGHEAAKRETNEEAGIKGEVIATLGTFMDHKKEYSIQFFSLNVTKEKKKWLENSTRKRQWFPIEEAITTVKKQYIVEVLESLKKSNA